MTDLVCGSACGTIIFGHLLGIGNNQYLQFKEAQMPTHNTSYCSHMLASAYSHKLPLLSLHSLQRQGKGLKTRE